MNSLRNLEWREYNSTLPTTTAILVATTAIFATAWLNADVIAAAKQAQAIQLGLPADFGAAGAVPWHLLLGPLYWIGLILVAGTVRFGMVAVLADKNNALLTNLAIAARGMIPLIVAGAVTGSLQNLWPLTPTGAPGGIAAPGAMSIGDTIVAWAIPVVLLAGWLGEGVLVSRASRAAFEQNWGRAVLTFLAPWVVFAIAAWFLLVP